MSGDHLPLRRVDHIKFIVGNARQSAYFYRHELERITVGF